LLAKVFIELEEIKRTPGHNRGEMLKNFDKTTTELVSASGRVNCLKTEALRFRAVSLVLSGKDKKALKYFKKSIGFAQWYGARVELARTWFELGKYLDAPGARYRQMNNLTGKDYLGKARSMFEEMDLQWDLQEYERYVEG
jgi:hypothetical protein